MTGPLGVIALDCGYDRPHLTDITFWLESGESLALHGPTGSGKTLLLNTILGFAPRWRGNLRIDHQSVRSWPTWRLARHYFGYVPQGRRVWGPLTVAEHLTVAARSGQPDVAVQEEILDRLPALAARYRTRADRLSGGEARMLSLARALIRSPRVLLLDEPAEGLTAQATADVAALLARLTTDGSSLIIVDSTGRLHHLAAHHRYLRDGGLHMAAVSFVDDPRSSR